MSDSEFEIKRQVDSICDEFESRWATDGKTAIQSLLDRVDSESRLGLLERLLAIDVERRIKADQAFVAVDYQDLGDEAVRYVEGFLNADSLVNEETTRDFDGQLDVTDETLAPDPKSPKAEPPTSVGRYQIKSVLGKGGFGLVYKAYDDQLKRHVAVKVPHAHLVNEQVDADAYLAEARTVANLDHPNIVPVHDVGKSDEFP